MSAEWKPNTFESRHRAGAPTHGLRLLMTVDATGGIWEYTAELARVLAPYQVEVVVASMGPRPTAAQRAALSALSNVALYESTYKLEWMNQPWDDVEAAGSWLLDLENRTRPSIIHLNGFCHGNLRWSAPCLVVGHSCVYSWFAAVRHHAPSGAGWEEYRRRVTAGLRAADLVTAPSVTMLTALKSYYGTFGDGGAVYNGRSAREFRPRKKEPIIFTAGRLWDEAKNIDALARLRRRTAWPIYAAGDCTSPDRQSQSLDGLQLLGRLSQTEMAQWLGRAAIFALPARYEPFGLAALEAALAGCVLVLGNIPSLREIWGDNALFVPPDDGDALWETLDRVARDERLCTRMARRARRRAAAFSAERMARGYIDLYRRLTAPVQNSTFKVQR